MKLLIPMMLIFLLFSACEKEEQPNPKEEPFLSTMWCNDLEWKYIKRQSLEGRVKYSDFEVNFRTDTLINNRYIPYHITHVYETQDSYKFTNRIVVHYKYDPIKPYENKPGLIDKWECEYITFFSQQAPYNELKSLISDTYVTDSTHFKFNDLYITLLENSFVYFSKKDTIINRPDNL